MYSVAIVEDDERDLETLEGYIERFAPEVSGGLRVSSFSDPEEFLAALPDSFDIVLLDIELGEGKPSGVEVAFRIRMVDERTVIVFVTNLYQFAIEGYKVRALDFLVKPLRYASFGETMRKAVAAAEKGRPHFVRLAFDKASRLVDVETITYVETEGKRLRVHCLSGETYCCNGPMRDLEERLEPYGFAGIHQSFLVNMHFVEHVSQTEVVVAGTTLPVSRYRRQRFVVALTDYVGGIL